MSDAGRLLGDLGDGWSDDLDDDEVFAPTPWDLAFAIGITPHPESESERAALDELADAMLMWADGPEVDELTRRTAGALWSGELEGLIRDGLARVGAHGDDWRSAAELAAVEFERDPVAAPVTAAVVQRLATALGCEDASPFFCTCCLEEGLARAPAAERRQRACAAAVLAVRDAGVPPEEVAAARAANAPQRLATDDRRPAVRARLARLARLGRRSLPELAGELERIGNEQLPADPADDDVWEVVAGTLLAEQAQPAWN